MTENANPAESAEKSATPPPEAPKEEPVSTQAAPSAETPAPAKKEGFSASAHQILREFVEQKILDGRNMPLPRNVLILSTLAIYLVSLAWIPLFILDLVGLNRLAGGVRKFYLICCLFGLPTNWPFLLMSPGARRYLKEQAGDSGGLLKMFVKQDIVNGTGSGGGCLFVFIGIPLLVLSLLGTILFNMIVKIPFVSKLAAKVVAPLKRFLDRIPERYFWGKFGHSIADTEKWPRNFGAKLLLVTLALIVGIFLLALTAWLLLLLIIIITDPSEDGFMKGLMFTGPFILGFVGSGFLLFLLFHFFRFRTFDWSDKNDVTDATAVLFSMLLLLAVCVICIVWPVCALAAPSKPDPERQAIERSFEAFSDGMKAIDNASEKIGRGDWGGAVDDWNRDVEQFNRELREANEELRKAGWAPPDDDWD